MRLTERTNWKAGFLTGLVSANVSTLLVTLGAKRIGRDPALDWMDVGTVLLRDGGVKVNPGWREIAAGLLVHQSADLFWATLFLGGGIGRLSRRQREALLALTVPWAVATSAIEYYALLPWLQPMLRVQVPYWTAMSVHLLSGTAYPLFFWIRERAGGLPDADATLSKETAALIALSVAALAGLELASRRGREVRWPFGGRRSRAAVRRFLRHMTWHHEIGARLAEQACERGGTEELRTLGRLMLGEHQAEIAIMRNWWRSWYDEPIAPLSEQEYRDMPGMPPRTVLDELDRLCGAEFDSLFLPTMVEHHRGALEMVRTVQRDGLNPRIWLFGQSLYHAQLRQIEWMVRLHWKHLANAEE